jgi:lipid-A-disaccharide synthase
VVDQLLVILPFETAFYAKHDFKVDFVGHPLLDVVQNFKTTASIQKSEKPLVALLPGSRAMEIKQVWPIMVKTIQANQNYDFVLALAPSLSESLFEGIRSLTNLTVVRGQTYELLHSADAALVTSGTATLETALFGVPEVVCYKGNALSYYIAKNLIKVKYISLVNLILDKPLVKELIQFDLNEQNLSKELINLFDPEKRNEILAGYKTLRQTLGEEGASMRAAQLILNK